MAEPLAVAKAKITTLLPNYNEMYKKTAYKEGHLLRFIFLQTIAFLVLIFAYYI